VFHLIAHLAKNKDHNLSKKSQKVSESRPAQLNETIHISDCHNIYVKLKKSAAKKRSLV